MNDRSNEGQDGRAGDPPRGPADGRRGDAPRPAAPTSGGPAGRGGKRWGRLAAATLLLPPLMLAAGVAGTWLSLHTEAGTRWWLGQVADRLPDWGVDLRLGPVRGALLGEGASLGVDRLEWNRGGTRLRVEGLRLDGLQLRHWRPEAPFVEVSARELGAERVGIDLEPGHPGAPPARAPTDLRLPMRLRLDRVAIARLEVPGLSAPIEDAQARIEAGATHHLRELSLRWQGVRVRAEAQIGAEAPLPLKLQLQARGEEGPGGQGAGDAAKAPPSSAPMRLPEWARGLTLALTAQGPLARFDAEARLEMAPTARTDRPTGTAVGTLAGAAPPRLAFSARVAPFDALPLARLDAQFSRLDLARLLAPFGLVAMPGTDLAGRAAVSLEGGGDQALGLELQARNAAPGAWDRQRLPLQELDLRLSGRGDRWRIEQARVRLTGEGGRNAGRVDASGQLSGLEGLEGLGAGHLDSLAGELKLVLEGLRPDLLDRRGPALSLSGPIGLRLTPARAAGPATAFGTLQIDARLSGELQGEARGRSPAPLRQPVLLALNGRATPDGATLEHLTLRAGRAHLEGRGTLLRHDPGWRSEGRLELGDFDPALWLPGDPAEPWRRASNSLQGHAAWQLDGTGPATGDLAGNPEAASASAPADPAPHAAGPGWSRLLRSLQGRIDADFHDSTLAGQPLSLRLNADVGAGRLEGRGELKAGGNRAELLARLRAPDGGEAPAPDLDRLQLNVEAPALGRLAPIARLLGIGPLAGLARVDARLEGSLGDWLPGGAHTGPAGTPIASRGSVHLESLQIGGQHLSAADGQWELTLPGASPERMRESAMASRVEARLEARQWQGPGLVVSDASLRVEGSLAAHQARLQATFAPAAPAGADAVPPPEGPASTPLQLSATAQGQWRPAEAGVPATWRLQLPALRLEPAAGAPGGALAGLATRRPSEPGGPGLRPLLQARDLALELLREPGRSRLELQPGQAEVVGARLHWQGASWEHREGHAPQMALDAEVEPLRLADLLERLQPDFGWGGELRVGARARLRSGPDFSAQVEIARTGGDLQVSEFGIVQTLGLSEARLALTAEGGVWRLTEAIEGLQLGRLSGEQTVRADPTASWPDAQAPIEGRFSAKVENLVAWSGWVPAGWRLAGRLDAALRVAGRFGAPQLIGEVSGRELGLRNALEGVTLTDGELDARFDGDTARLGQLRFKAGAGSVLLTGGAQLGERPEAELQLLAERATVLGRVDRRVVASGRATLKADARRLAVDGGVRVDEGLIDISRSDAPTLGDDVSVRRRGDTEGTGTPAATRRPARAVELNLAVDLGSRLALRGRGIDTRLGGELRLSSPGGRLAARGEIRTDSGTYEAYGQKLEIARGVITFVGPIENPRLDIEAVRARSDTRVGVTVGGSVQSPRVRLFSDPDLPATEKLALLVTGRSYDSLAGADTLLLQRAALALLAGDGSGATDFNVARILQLDELSVRQSDGVLRDTIFTLGKQISDRVYVGYERGLNAATGNWQLIYRIAQRFTLRAQSGEDSALDLIWLFRWN